MYYSATTKYDIVNSIAHDYKLHREIKGICKTSDIEDLLQELYIILLDKVEEFICGLNERNQIKYFIIKIIQNQYLSNDSPYTRKFKKRPNHIEFDSILNDEISSNIEVQRSYNEFITTQREEEQQDFKAKKIEEKILFIQQELSKMDWYDKLLFNDYYMDEDATYAKLSKKTHIPITSIFNSVKSTKNKIKKAYKKKNE